MVPPSNSDSSSTKRQFTVAFSEPPTPRRGSGNASETPASSSTLPMSSSTEALQRFLSWKTLPVLKSTSHTPSSATRKPKYYDMHLAKPLRLENIVYLPDLPELIGSVCDTYLEKFDATSIPPTEFPLYGQYDDEKSSNKMRKVSNEKGLQAHYAEETGKLCPLVASALAFNLKAWNENAFEFTFKPTIPQAHAKADGFMDIKDEQLGSDISQKIDLIRKHQLNHPVVWEFKSLSAGDIKNMKALTRIEGQFPWRTCDVVGKHTFKCGHKDHAKGNRYSVTGRLRTSPDAICTESLLARSRYYSTDGASTQGFRGSVDEDLEDTSDDDEAEVRSDESGDNSDWEDVETVTQGHTATSRGHAKRRSKTHQRRPAKPKSRKSTKKKDAYSIIQQGWTEAVINDATIIIFNAGKYELLCVRHRVRKTLYISSIIEVEREANPPHGKLHTALYLAGYEDALDRASQMEKISRADVNDQPLLFKLAVTDTGFLNVEGMRDHWSEMQIREIMVEQLRSSSDVYINLPSDIAPIGYPAYRPLKMTAEAEQGSSTGDDGLVFEFGEHLDGKAWAVSLTQTTASQEDGTGVRYSAPFVMKFATSAAEFDALQRECDTYHVLASEQVAPYLCRHYGLFDWSLEGSMLWGLLLDRGGDTFQTLTKKERTTPAFKGNIAKFEKALSSLHASGYQHGNLNHNHILMNESGHVFLISLAQCQRVDASKFTSATAGPSTMEAEMNSLSKSIAAARKKFLKSDER